MYWERMLSGQSLTKAGHSGRGGGYLVETVKQYLRDVAEQVELIDAERIAAVVSIIVDTLSSGQRVYIAGNGGSATTAAHMVTDINAAARVNRYAGAAFDLVQAAGVVTALGNDVCFERIFSDQLHHLAAPGDLFVGLSVSGESANLMEAARVARERNCTTVALLGLSGSLSDHCEYSVIVGSGDYGLVEDLHLSINHMTCRALRGVRSHTCLPSDHSVASGP